VSDTEEISFRDLYLALKRRWVLIAVSTLVLPLIVLIVSFMLPKIYESRAVMGVNLSVQSNQQGLLSNLPPLQGLLQGFVDLQTTAALAGDLGVKDPSQFFRARFDKERTIINLTAKGNTPKVAKERLERMVSVATSYLRKRMLEGVQANVQATLSQTRLDVQTAKEGLKRIQEQLRVSPDNGVRINPLTVAALEAIQTDPQIARAANPGITSLSLDESRIRSQIAQMDGKVVILTQMLDQPQKVSALVNQALLVQILVPPAEPLRPVFPRPALFAAVAGVLGLLLGIIWAFIAEAVRPSDRAPGGIT
jgi:LPS O-antigen subunit length determinant protein (WzzB/FepE family)